MDLSEGKGLAAAVSDSTRPDSILPIWLAGGTFWIPTMLCVYRFVPLHARVVVTSAANVVWSTYLSTKQQKGLREAGQTDAAAN